jgi:hypothetical protein
LHRLVRVSPKAIVGAETNHAHKDGHQQAREHQEIARLIASKTADEMSATTRQSPGNITHGLCSIGRMVAIAMHRKSIPSSLCKIGMFRWILVVFAM